MHRALAYWRADAQWRVALILLRITKIEFSLIKWWSFVKSGDYSKNNIQLDKKSQKGLTTETVNSFYSDIIMISCKKDMKRQIYVHFGDTRPHRAVLEIHPYYLFSNWCAIDLYLRTKARIYSVKKNLLSKPSRVHHIFSA